MKLSASLALALCLTTTLTAQTTFTDPANLRGERVTPSDGHELPIDQGASGLAQLLRKLNTRASLLLITAHPDDEDGGMLTLTSRGLGARVATLTLNRGEGGQNFVTPDFEDALGLIRTQELLSADRYFDASQFFGTEVDFGFSKTKEESFQKWGHERVLYDAVRAIRLYRPLVIAAVFVGGVTDGHGQHQVSGEIAQEAFKAAADPTVFPDMIKEGILPWQALKVYAHVPFADISSKGVFDYATDQYVPARFTNYVTGQVTTTKPTADVIVPEGTTDPLLTDPATNQPRSYVQFARIGLGLQRTQISKNMRLPSAGKYDSAYHLYGSVLNTATSKAPTARPITAQGSALGERTEDTLRAEGPIYNSNLTTQPNFFTGIDTSIEGIAALAPQLPVSLRTGLRGVSYFISLASAAFEASHSPHAMDAVATPLAEALKDADALITGVEASHLPPDQKANVLHELRIKRVQLNDALVVALGLHLDATSSSSDLVENSTAEVKTHLSEDSAAPLSYDNMDISGAGWGRGQSFHDSVTPQISSSHPLDHDWQILADHMAEITQPYFYRDNTEQPIYKLRDSALRNAPQTPAPLTAWATVTYQGTEITLGRIVHNGDQPVSIIPPVSIASAPTATVLPNGQTTAQLTATLRTDATTSANINVQSPHNWSIEAKAIPASAPTPIPDTTHSIHFFLHPTAPTTGPQLFHVTAQTPDHHTYTEGYRPVGYPGLIYTNFYTPATTRVVPVDLKLPEHLRIAYLPGTGDAVPEALATIGLNPTLITVADFTPTRLANFDTVILGVRAYTAHPDLHGAPTQTLLNWASSGGNVVVQYETSGLTSADTPYPLSLGDAEKVVDETDPVQLLEPSPATNRYPEASASGLIGAGNEGVLTPRYALLNIPNKITPADFDNWTEERGHGFLDTWDPHYTALTNVQDPGGPETARQLPQRGGLITASVGKGRWTYCAFALYRQLPEAVPGAFRLFVNLLTPTR
jgi:LmbE family N-acetylglucosaminyl deacetylase